MDCFQSDRADLRLVLKSYRLYEQALLTLPRPTLVICKSSARASAVAVAFKAVSESMSLENILKLSEEKNLKYLGVPGLKMWVTTIIQNVSSAQRRVNNLIFRQLFDKESSTYSYLLADQISKDAILIEPVLDTVERDAEIIRELGLNLKYAVNTHVHSDHVVSSFHFTS